MAPTYTYQCGSCEAQIEAQRTISERSDSPPCPLCKGRTERIMSLTAPVQPSRPIDVSNITGKRGQTAANAREADAIADRHNQIIIPKSEFKNKMGRKPKTRTEDIKAELQKIDKAL